jgi:hypothetical protein
VLSFSQIQDNVPDLNRQIRLSENVEASQAQNVEQEFDFFAKTPVCVSRQPRLERLELSADELGVGLLNLKLDL